VSKARILGKKGKEGEIQKKVLEKDALTNPDCSSSLVTSTSIDLTHDDVRCLDDPAILLDRFHSPICKGAWEHWSRAGIETY